MVAHHERGIRVKIEDKHPGYQLIYSIVGWDGQLKKILVGLINIADYMQGKVYLENVSS